MRASARRLVAAVLAATLSWPLAASAQDLEQVEARIDDLEGALARATASYEETVAAVEGTRTELAQLEERAAALEAEAATVEARLVDRARTVFMYGGEPVLAMLMSADGPAAAIERASLIAVVTERDEGQLESARSLRLQLGQTKALLADKASELADLEAQLERHTAILTDRLARAESVASELRAIEARKRRIQRGVQDGIYACIFERGTTSFRDTWGAPRSGGRAHKGTDVFAVHGAPVYAFTDGRVRRISHSGLGGLGLYLSGDDGNVYYYAHLDSIAPGISSGRRVEAGEFIARNGSSGNASRSAPHVHFELHPGGGGAVNPYQWLAAACFR